MATRTDFNGEIVLINQVPTCQRETYKGHTIESFAITKPAICHRFIEAAQVQTLDGRIIPGSGLTPIKTE